MGIDNFIATDRNNHGLRNLTLALGLFAAISSNVGNSESSMLHESNPGIEAPSEAILTGLFCTDDSTLKMYSSKKRNLELLLGIQQMDEVMYNLNLDILPLFSKNSLLPEGIEIRFPLKMLPAEQEHLGYLEDCKTCVVIDLDMNVFYLYKGNDLALSTRSADSQRGYSRLSPGTYSIKEKVLNKRSIKFDAAAMPYAQRIHGNYYFHSGVINDSGRISHGCIRLPHAYAAEAYTMTSLVDKVVVLHKNSRNKPL